MPGSRVRPDAIAVVGVSHWSAPLAERERFAFGKAVTRRLLQARNGERLLLVTCNRTELYGVGSTDDLRGELLEGAGAADVSLDARSGERAVSHLFSVASGLDSMVLGEYQILGQVKRAMREAREEGALGPLLDELARRALQVGRRVRRETDIGKSLPSIPKVAVGVARLVLGELGGARILVVGSGKLGDLTARALGRTGAQEIVVTNRNPDRARTLAEAVGGRAEPYPALDRLLAETDLVISCTAAPAPVLSRERVERALAGRSNRRLALIDIAVPRDVDPTVRSLPGVRLFDLDDLREWSSVSVAPEILDAARTIVEDETRDFQAWLAGRTAVPTIRELHERAEAILDAEIRRIPEDEREAARRFGRRLLRKLLHPPVSRLRDGAASDGEAYVRLARELFDLDDERRERWNGGGESE
jgi:glutamyl-tRNA reductase